MITRLLIALTLLGLVTSCDGTEPVDNTTYEHTKRYACEQRNRTRKDTRFVYVWTPQPGNNPDPDNIGECVEGAGGVRG